MMEKKAIMSASSYFFWVRGEVRKLEGVRLLGLIYLCCLWMAC